MLYLCAAVVGRGGVKSQPSEWPDVTATCFGFAIGRSIVCHSGYGAKREIPSAGLEISHNVSTHEFKDDFFFSAEENLNRQTEL